MSQTHLTSLSIRALFSDTVTKCTLKILNMNWQLSTSTRILLKITINPNLTLSIFYRQIFRLTSKTFQSQRYHFRWFLILSTHLIHFSIIALKIAAFSCAQLLIVDHYRTKLLFCIVFSRVQIVLLVVSLLIVVIVSIAQNRSLARIVHRGGGEKEKVAKKHFYCSEVQWFKSLVRRCACRFVISVIEK